MKLTPDEQEILDNAVDDIKRARRIIKTSHLKTKFKITFLNEQGNCEITYDFKGTINESIYDRLRQVTEVRTNFPQAKKGEMLTFKYKVRRILKEEGKIFRIMAFTTLHWWSLYTEYQKTTGSCSVRDFVKKHLLQEIHHENPPIPVNIRSNGDPSGSLFTKNAKRDKDNNRD